MTNDRYEQTNLLQYVRGKGAAVFTALEAEVPGDIDNMLLAEAQNLRLKAYEQFIRILELYEDDYYN